jgi:hypothetical protein
MLRQISLSLVACMTLLCIAVSSYSQNNIVNGRKVFTCMNDDAGVQVDSFPNPDGAVNHYITKHMPSGFKLKPGTIEVLENGWVVFVTHKNGQQEASQGGHVLGRILCPPDSWVSSENGGSFYDKKCNCNQGYVAYGDSCKRPEDIPKEEEPKTEEPKDECAKKNAALTAAQQQLKDNVTKRLKEVVDQENQLLAKDLARAQKVLTKDELNHYGLKFYAGYGHALERLTNEAVKKDPLLSKNLEYISNRQQLAAGGGPDFRGKGKLPSSVEFDITTEKEMEKKLKTKDEKKCYQFVTYERLTDRQGNLLE